MPVSTLFRTSDWSVWGHATGRWLRLAMLLQLVALGAWAQCAAPTNLTTTSVTGSGATINFTPSPNATSYTVSYTYPGGGTAQTVVPNPTTSPVVLSALRPLTAYTVSVASNCAGGGTSAATTVTFVTGTANDDPCTATPLPLGGSTCQATSSTTTNATTTPANGYAQLACGGTSAPHDVWFTFTTAATGAASTGATISVSGNPAGEIRLFAASSCNSPFTSVTCSAVSNPLGNQQAPALTVDGLTPGTTYYVRVAGYYNNNNGPFTICVRNPPACGDPNNVLISNITTSSAQFSLRPGSGNVSYAIAYGPTSNPTANTLNTSNPQATLTGLSPLTTYTLTVQATCADGSQGGVITRTFTTPNANDEPATAVALPLGGASCQPTASTLQAATATTANGYPSGCAGFVYDVWYTFTTAATGLASIGATVTVGPATPPSMASTREVRIFRSAGGATGPFTALACATGSSNAAVSAVADGLTPGTTYYVRVGGPFASGSFTVCVTDPPACPVPTNLTASYVSNTSQQVSWTSSGGGGTYTVEYGLTGFAPGTGQTVTGITGTSTMLTGLTAGATYQFYVTRTCSLGNVSPRVGPATFEASIRQPNDEPCGAIALPVGSSCTPQAFSAVGATQTTPNGYTIVGCVNNNIQRDVWFTFTTAGAGLPGSTAVTIVATDSAAGQLRAFRAGSCAGPFTPIGCSTRPARAEAPPLILTGLTPATTYYVNVSYLPGLSGQSLQFTLCVTAEAPACPTPTNVEVDNLQANSARLTFTAPTGSPGYVVTYQAAGGPVQTLSPAPTASPVTLLNLTPDTPYTVTLRTACSAGQGVAITLSFRTLPGGPPNDMCTGATLITCGQNLLGTTINATNVGDPTQAQTCSPFIGVSAGVFYRFVGTGDSIVVSLCNPGTPQTTTVMNVYSGACGNLNCVTGDEGTPTCSATASFNSLQGVNYYIYVVVVGQTGTFELSARCAQRGCIPPTNVVASVITGTGASVRFTPANTRATSYTVTATPTTGGPAISATSPASPLALSGLLANTSYSVCVQANCPGGTASACSAPPVVIRTLLAARLAELASLVGLYPNPAHHAVTLRLPAELSRQAVATVLYNTLGQPVRTQTLPASATVVQATLDLHGLPAGIYVLRLQTERGTLAKQLVIE